jgi:serine-type D-Ala-D-Ala carboxypeptidase (penicillin-binding protein 5/6)
MVAPFQLDSLTTPDPEPPGRGRHAATSRRHWSWKWTVVLLVVALLAAGGAFIAIRLRAPVAAATMKPTLPATVTVAAAPVTLPWAAVGQSAISVPSLGVAEKSGTEVPVPIASLTKMMTAYVILRDHPLAPGQSGPNITMTQTDVSDYDTDTNEDEANAAMTVGEVLTEQQLLEGMLIHSANDFADALALWDAGSIPAFVVKMNQSAAHIGMSQTTYADASGYSDASQSTASDNLMVAALDMANPTFAAIVKMPTVTLPVAGTVSTYTPILGAFGVVGVKSGFTSAAGGCDVLAFDRVVHGQTVMVLAAVTGQTGIGQPDVLLAAGKAALSLAYAASSALGTTSVVRGGGVVARVSAAGHSVSVVAQSTVNVLTWPGVSYHRVVLPTRTVKAGDAMGTRVGSVVVAVGDRHIVVPARLGSDLPKESLLQRIF